VRIHDISAALSPEHAPPPNTPGMKLEPLTHLEQDGWNSFVASFATHHGTHLDAPRHYDNDGWDVAELPLAVLVGPAFVLDCRGKAEIGPEELKRVPRGCRERIIFRTDNSEQWSDERQMPLTFVPLSPAAARQLVRQGTRLVGTDGPSIEPFVNTTGDAVHNALCPGKVVILEGLRLAEVPEGEYELIALPLKVVGADAFPVRAVLIERK